jgi:hypothetical protein
MGKLLENAKFAFIAHAFKLCVAFIWRERRIYPMTESKQVAREALGHKIPERVTTSLGVGRRDVPARQEIHNIQARMAATRVDIGQKMRQLEDIQVDIERVKDRDADARADAARAIHNELFRFTQKAARLQEIYEWCAWRLARLKEFDDFPAFPPPSSFPSRMVDGSLPSSSKRRRGVGYCEWQDLLWSLDVEDEKIRKRLHRLRRLVDV